MSAHHFMDNGEKLLHLTKAQPYKSSVHALALGSSHCLCSFLGANPGLH